jgi:6-phosphogluconate dehydrogenase (decarboxylating)
MRFGIIGLGRMGGKIALQELDKKHDVVGYNRTEAKALELAPHGLEPAGSLEELVGVSSSFTCPTAMSPKRRVRGCDPSSKPGTSLSMAATLTGRTLDGGTTS